MPARSVHPADAEHTVNHRRDTVVGTVLDGYRIDAKLAEGGFGSVYRAYHLSTGEVVALKLLHPHLARDPNMTARFQREAATMWKLRDVHTVATRAIGESVDGTLYIAMELLVGEMLHERMAVAERLPWRQAVAVVRAICSSLAEAHALGVVHRDLKPANVHLSDHGDFVKVIDFGIVQVRASDLDDGEDLTRVGTTVGTLDYMSPEQVMDRPCDARSDLYAVGVMLYELVTGVRPYGNITGPQLLAAMLTQSAVPMSSVMAVPESLERVVMTCLRRDAANRYASVTDLAAELDLLLGRPPTLVFEDQDEATVVALARPRDLSRASLPSAAAPAHSVGEVGTVTALPPPPPPAYAVVALPSRVPMPLVSPRAARGSVAALGPRATWTPLAYAIPAPLPALPPGASPVALPRTAELFERDERDRAAGRWMLAIALALSGVLAVVGSQLL